MPPLSPSIDKMLNTTAAPILCGNEVFCILAVCASGLHTMQIGKQILMRTFNQALPALKTLLCASLLLMATAFAVASNEDDNQAWVKPAERSITRINTQLAAFDVVEGDTALLDRLEKQLFGYRASAQQCIEQKMPQVAQLKSNTERIEADPNQVTAGFNAEQALGPVSQMAAATEAQLVACQAVLLNAESLISTIQTLNKSILTDYLLSRGDPLFTVLRINFGSLAPAVDSLHNFLDVRQEYTGFSVVDWLVLVMAIILSWFAGRFFGKKLRLKAGLKPIDGITAGLISATYACLGRGLPLLMAAVAATLVLAAELPLTPLPISVAFFGSLSVYLLTIIATRTLLCPSAPAKYFFTLDVDLARSLYNRLQFLLVLGLVAVFAFLTSMPDTLTPAQWALARASFMALSIINLVWLISYLNPAPGLLGNTALRSVVSIALLIVLAAEFWGFQNLAGYIYKGAISSILLGIGLWLVYVLLNDTLDSLDEGRRSWGRQLRAKLELTDEEHVPGILWIRVFSVLAIWMFFIISMMQLWRYSDDGWAWFFGFVNEGFDIGNVRIIPVQVILGLGLFVVLLTLIRWFRYETLSKWVLHTSLDHGGREALVTISGYVGVLFAAVLGLSIAGFNFTSIAIVAGALSVGIGFGLQNIVNNFVSGLILLFERPIRTGDWIVVGNTEGYVRKISIRSTLIETFDRADVIVPNSEFISGQVTNWMLHDSWGRVIVPVGVAYGSDVRKVEALLIACANEHPLVLKDHEMLRPPSVLFRGFGDSSLNFELRAFISEIDQRITTISDLNFAIEQALRENDIVIPFPQRDVHIHSADPRINITSPKPTEK